MKKSFLSLSLATILLSNNLFAEDIFDQTSEENVSKNISKKDNQSQNLLNKEDLDYLFKNSDTKFPVTDYIYKGGFKEPNEEIKIHSEEKPKKEEDNNITKLAKIEEKKQELIQKNQQIAKEIHQDNISSQERK